ncbi:MAG TPA: helix-turn-helix transcriptional regulator [Rhizomicrobium sp.]
MIRGKKKRKPEALADLKVLAAEIRRHRARLDISQEELADRAGLHRNYIGFVERTENDPSMTKLFKIAHGLGLTPSQLLEGIAKGSRR